MKIPIEPSRKKSAYSVYVYGAFDVRLFPNKCLIVDLKNIEIWVSHGLNIAFADVEKEMWKTQEGEVRLGKRKIFSLSYADDVILLANNDARMR